MCDKQWSNERERGEKEREGDILREKTYVRLKSITPLDRFVSHINYLFIRLFLKWPLQRTALTRSPIRSRCFWHPKEVTKFDINVLLIT